MAPENAGKFNTPWTMMPVQKETPRRARGLDSLPHEVQEFLPLFPMASTGVSHYRLTLATNF